MDDRLSLPDPKD
ncbi:unnamed protein product, partial [Didymodactylos carnosus]